MLIARTVRHLFRLLRKLVIISFIYLILKIPWVYYFHLDGQALLENKTTEDILFRRTYLISRFRNGAFAPSTMPGLIGAFFQGEWATVTCSMTVAALTNIAFLLPETRQESVTIIEQIGQIMLTKEFRHFDSSAWGEDALTTLDSEHGHIGYLGHLNFVLGAYLLLGGENSEFTTRHQEISAALIRRLDSAPFPYLETYPRQIYSADNLVVYASIKLFDLNTKQNHSPLFQRWTEYTTTHLLDPNTGLLVFNLTSKGTAVGTARGSGVGWNSFYLPFFAPEFAQDQFSKANTHLVTALPFGARALREFPRGISGRGDIDSGPLVFGFSPSGTGFFTAGARHAKDVALLGGLLDTAEFAGSTIQWKGERNYLFAPMVGEAIMLAMKTATIWDTRYQ